MQRTGLTPQTVHWHDLEWLNRTLTTAYNSYGHDWDGKRQEMQVLDVSFLLHLRLLWNKVHVGYGIHNRVNNTP